MRKINKNEPPDSFVKWIKKKPNDKTENQWFRSLYEQKKWSIVSDLLKHNAKEQFYLCAYCCGSISGEGCDTVNEHVEARSTAQQRSLDHKNIVASCRTKNQCDDAHKNQTFSLTPLMDECETELQFNISGRVVGLTDRAIETIRVLNLGDKEKNNKALIEKRRQLSNNLMWSNGINPTEGLEDDDLLRSLVEDFITPKNDRLDPFAPVVANILRNWIVD